MSKRPGANRNEVGGAPNTPAKRRSNVSQSDVPAFSLEQAARVPRAIGENYAFKPTKPLNVAAAMNMTPASGPFRGRCGAALAYELTTASYSAPEIGITPLGMRIVRPVVEGDDVAAKREAVLNPRIFREFLEHYNGAPLPKEDIARNVLIDMGVPPDRAADALGMIIESANSVGLIRQIKDKRYVDLDGVAPPRPPAPTSDAQAPADEETPFQSLGSGGEEAHADAQMPSLDGPLGRANPQGDARELERERSRRRVFVTHGKNRSFVELIRKLLAFGELEPIVSVERQSVSQPVPDKVMNDMRSCGAAIIHVDAELKLIDAQAKEHVMVNPNVLIEIGAAMALYGRRFILLVRDGVQMPSNLQGLFEVRYNGDALDGDTTIKLLEAINDMKNHPMPARYPDGNEQTAEP